MQVVALFSKYSAPPLTLPERKSRSPSASISAKAGVVRDGTCTSKSACWSATAAANLHFHRKTRTHPNPRRDRFFAVSDKAIFKIADNVYIHDLKI